MLQTEVPILSTKSHGAVNAWRDLGVPYWRLTEIHGVCALPCGEPHGVEMIPSMVLKKKWGTGPPGLGMCANRSVWRWSTVSPWHCRVSGAKRSSCIQHGLIRRCLCLSQVARNAVYMCNNSRVLNSNMHYGTMHSRVIWVMLLDVRWIWNKSRRRKCIFECGLC